MFFFFGGGVDNNPNTFTLWQAENKHRFLHQWTRPRCSRWHHVLTVRDSPPLWLYWHYVSYSRTGEHCDLLALYWYEMNPRHCVKIIISANIWILTADYSNSWRPHSSARCQLSFQRECVGFQLQLVFHPELLTFYNEDNHHHMSAWRHPLKLLRASSSSTDVDMLTAWKVVHVLRSGDTSQAATNAYPKSAYYLKNITFPSPCVSRQPTATPETVAPISSVKTNNY